VSQSSELQTYRRKTEFNAKCPFKVVQGHVFWSQWKGEHPKIRVQYGWGRSTQQKTCNIYEMGQDRTKVTVDNLFLFITSDRKDKHKQQHKHKSSHRKINTTPSGDCQQTDQYQ